MFWDKSSGAWLVNLEEVMTVDIVLHAYVYFLCIVSALALKLIEIQ